MRLQDIDGYTPIVHKSIDNVKCTRIISGENSDKYNKYIQYLAKKILMISAKRTDGYVNDEVGILARLDGTHESQPIYGYWNEKAETSIISIMHNIEYNYMLDENKEQSLVFVHNHPNNSEISINDAFSCLTAKAIKCTVAVGNNGCINYMIKTSSNFENIRLKIIKSISHGVKKEAIYNKIINSPEKYYIDINY